MPDKPTWSHHNPVRIECAALETLAKFVSAQHVLLVTTSGFVKRGVVQRVKDILAPRQVTVWDGVKSNPDLQDLDAAAQSLRMLGIGSVVGLGGGSALDAAKVLATTIPSPAQPSMVQVFRDKVATQWAPRLPLVVIPTTSGTGAEVTPFATVWDHEQHKKYSLSGDFVFPDVALLDATLTLTLGGNDTLYPALDSISHALESLWNKNCTPVSRAFAFQALSITNESLPQVMIEPYSHKVRMNLQNASVLAGLAISQTRTAVAHAISYPLTSTVGIPHGLACSFLLEKMLEDNAFQIARNDQESLVLVQTKEMLANLNLKAEIANFIKISNLKEMTHSVGPLEERSQNYIGSDIKQILNKYFND